jgi:hypothetical protein
LPSGDGGHTSRTVRVGPDGRVYVSLGISGNCSNQYLGKDYPFVDRRGGVFVLEESGAKPVLRPFAAGLRNPIGFDWQPQTGVLYASNNGPDHWGFELPPEYLSRERPVPTWTRRRLNAGRGKTANVPEKSMEPIHGVRTSNPENKSSHLGCEDSLSFNKVSCSQISLKKRLAAETTAWHWRS